MTRYRRWDGVAVLAAAAAIGLTACSGTSAPHVANLGRSRGGDVAASTSTVPAGSPTQLLDKWASCMRSHGDPNQVDPTVDATKVIQVDSARRIRRRVARREWRVRLLPERGRDGAGRWHADRVVE